MTPSEPEWRAAVQRGEFASAREAWAREWRGREDELGPSGAIAELEERAGDALLLADALAAKGCFLRARQALYASMPRIWQVHHGNTAAGNAEAAWRQQAFDRCHAKHEAIDRYGAIRGDVTVLPLHPASPPPRVAVVAPVEMPAFGSESSLATAPVLVPVSEPKPPPDPVPSPAPASAPVPQSEPAGAPAPGPDRETESRSVLPLPIRIEDPPETKAPSSAPATGITKDRSSETTPEALAHTELGRLTLTDDHWAQMGFGQKWQNVGDALAETHPACAVKAYLWSLLHFFRYAKLWIANLPASRFDSSGTQEVSEVQDRLHAAMVRPEGPPPPPFVAHLLAGDLIAALRTREAVQSPAFAPLADLLAEFGRLSGRP